MNDPLQKNTRPPGQHGKKSGMDRPCPYEVQAARADGLVLWNLASSSAKAEIIATLRAQQARYKAVGKLIQAQTVAHCIRGIK